MPRIKKLKTNNYILIILSMLALFFATAVVAAQQIMNPTEKVVFDFIYGWHIDAQPLFWAITQLGSVWVAISGLVIFWWYKRDLAIKLFIGGLLTYSLVQIAKILIDRPRPHLLVSGVSQKETLVSGLGFPSGHTAFITVFAVIIQPYLPKKWRWTVWLAVIAVAISRIYLGVHAPLDVIGGFAIGAFVGYSIRYFIQKKPSKILKN